jgi:hypothetical protein
LQAAADAGAVIRAQIQELLMKRTAGVTMLACSTLLCVGASIGLLAQQKNGANPLLKEPLRLKQGQLAGVPGRNQAIAVFNGIPFGAPFGSSR